MRVCTINHNYKYDSMVTHPPTLYFTNHMPFLVIHSHMILIWSSEERIRVVSDDFLEEGPET